MILMMRQIALEVHTHTHTQLSGVDHDSLTRIIIHTCFFFNYPDSTFSTGCISVPVNISIRWVSIQSGYAKALKAKERLLAIIRERLDSSL